jgi:hypothetical protein
MIGRGSLFGIFGLIGVGMCYFLAVLSLSSIDYLHKRRRLEDRNRFGSPQSADNLESGMPPMRSKMQPSLEDYEYMFRRMQMQQFSDYVENYNHPENVQMYPYYNPPEEQSQPNSQTYFSNKFNKPQYMNRYNNRVHDNRDHDKRDDGYYADSSSLSFRRQRPPYPHLIRRMRRSFESTSIQQKHKIIIFLLSLDKNSLFYKFMLSIKSLKSIKTIKQ